MEPNDIFYIKQWQSYPRPSFATLQMHKSSHSGVVSGISSSQVGWSQITITALHYPHFTLDTPQCNNGLAVRQYRTKNNNNIAYYFCFHNVGFAGKHPF